MLFRKSSIFGAALLAAGLTAQAAEWSDTAIGYRYGKEFSEPFNDKDIAKNIVSLTHASGYKYGSNFFNADILLSDKNDPSAPNSDTGAQEIYVVYRHTLDLGKASGANLKVGPFRGFGLTVGFDANSKNDAGYNSSKRMLVAGPTAMLDVPGFLNVSLLQLWESNAPYNKFSNTGTERYSYDPHPMLTLTWGVPVGALPLTFSGYANFIADKGTDEFGNETKSETNIDMALMYDASTLMGANKNTLQVGLGYQYWKNKFGNDHKGAAGYGAYAKTPMFRTEYHF